MDKLVDFATRHGQLSLALVIILLAIFISEFLAQKKRARELSPTDAVNMINHERAVVVDIRSLDLYNQGHILGAIRSSEEDFTQKRMNKYQSKPLILVCARGISSATLATKLKAQGFENVQVLAGGITAWQAAGLPVVKKTK